MTTEFDKKLFAFLCIGFITATIVGTLSHELGHFLTAKYLGYGAEINYASTSIHVPRGETMFASDSFWISFGGPFLSMLAGTTGFILLFVYCQSYYSTEQLELRHWALIFLALFWLRQPALFLLNSIGNLSANKQHIDEIKIANSLQLPGLLILGLGGAIGIAVLLSVVFRFIPHGQRFTFMLAGAVGGITGYVLWMFLLGPVLLP